MTQVRLYAAPERRRNPLLQAGEDVNLRLIRRWYLASRCSCFLKHAVDVKNPRQNCTGV